MRLIDIGKTYGDHAVLEHIDLTLEEGKITAVLGESGAGKTTLLNILSGMTDYTGKLEGAKPVSYLFQDATLLPHLSVSANLRFVLPKSEWGKIDGMLERVGLAGKEKRLPKALSGGEKQRVAIARAFLYPHELLLMDEPFASLDLSLKEKLIGLVAELWRERGNTVVFVTHDVHEAALLSHRALVLRGGRLAGDFPIHGAPPRDFFSRPYEEDILVRTLMAKV